MKPILVLYATREGHTRRIAEHIAATIRARGYFAEVIDAADLPSEFSMEDYEAAVLAASVHREKHEEEMIRFVQRFREELECMRAVFLSVSLSEAGAEDAAATPEHRAQVHQVQFRDPFRDETHCEGAGRQHGHVARSRTHGLGGAGSHRG